jgi:hypothetical protein
MDYTVSMLNKKSTTNFSLTSTEYSHWKKLYTFDGLQGAKYGQSFCQQFDIVDNILQYCLPPLDADSYIQEHYIVK